MSPYILILLFFCHYSARMIGHATAHVTVLFFFSVLTYKTSTFIVPSRELLYCFSPMRHRPILHSLCHPRLLVELCYLIGLFHTQTIACFFFLFLYQHIFYLYLCVTLLLSHLYERKNAYLETIYQIREFSPTLPSVFDDLRSNEH